MIKIGIIGAGHMGTYHINACSSLSNVQLIAIADTDPKNLSKIKVAKIIKSKDYTTWLDLVDAVIIATPTESHYPIARECLLANKHVLIEKPITKTLKEAEDLFAIAQQKNLSLHVGHVERFNGAVQELSKIIQQPYFIESHRIGPFSPRPQKDSVVLDLMIHDLDIILNLVKSPIESINIIGNKIKTSLNDIAIVQIKFKNNILANIISSRASQIKKRTMAIHQKNSFIHLDFTTQDIAIHSKAHDSVKVGSNQMQYKQEGTVKHLFVYKDNALKLEIENFVKSIKMGCKATKPDEDTIALGIALQLEKMLDSSQGA